MKVALVYDRVNKWGGAERVLLVLHKLFPKAPLYTSVYNRETAPWAGVFPKIYSSFLQNIPIARTEHELFSPLMPFAFEPFNFDNYDVVISVTSDAAKGIITKPKTLHICYCLSPTRYLWQSYSNYFKNPIFRFATKPVVSYLRTWDKVAAQRPDYMVAISNNVKDRIKQYYDRESTVIYPPVTPLGGALVALAGPASGFPPASARPSLALPRMDSALSGSLPPASPASGSPRQKTKRYTLDARRYFLVVSRLVPYKRIDIAIEACNRLKFPLIIVGIGRQERKLRKLAGPTIRFLSNLADDELYLYYKNARALIFPGIEDFGIAMVEANLSGTPVIAYRAGGAREIVIEGETGAFFGEQNVSSLASVLKTFDKKRYNSKYCIESTERFSIEKFEKEFTEFIKEKVKEYFK